MEFLQQTVCRKAQVQIVKFSTIITLFLLFQTMKNYIKNRKVTIGHKKWTIMKMPVSLSKLLRLPCNLLYHFCPRNNSLLTNKEIFLCFLQFPLDICRRKGKKSLHTFDELQLFDRFSTSRPLKLLALVVLLYMTVNRNFIEIQHSWKYLSCYCLVVAVCSSSHF